MSVFTTHALQRSHEPEFVYVDVPKAAEAVPTETRQEVPGLPAKGNDVPERCTQIIAAEERRGSCRPYIHHGEFWKAVGPLTDFSRLPAEGPVRLKIGFDPGPPELQCVFHNLYTLTLSMSSFGTHTFPFLASSHARLSWQSLRVP